MLKPKPPYFCLLLFLLVFVLPIGTMNRVFPVYGAAQKAIEKAIPAPKPLSSSLFPLLVAQSDTIVVAQVSDAKTDWNAEHSSIVTEYRFTTVETLLQPKDSAYATPLFDNSQFSIRADGGFLEAEGIGLWVSHTASFTPGEVVLLFLREADQTGGRAENTQMQFQLAAGELGKFTIQDTLVRNDLLALKQPLKNLLAKLNQQLRVHGQQPVDIANTINTISPVVAQDDVGVASLSKSVYTTGEPPRWVLSGLEIEVKINLNSVQIDEETNLSSDFHMAIRRAMRTWSVIHSADFTILYTGETTVTATGYNGENEIVFMRQGANKPIGQAQIWYTAENVILEVDLWLNDDYQFHAGNEPKLTEVDLESVVLHELGHWVPLDHLGNQDAVMYSVLGTMEIKRDLHADDINAMVQLHPCDFPPCVHDVYSSEMATPTPKPSPTVTATPTIAPTVPTAVSPTPTLIPTRFPTGVDFIYLPYIVR